MKNKLNLKKEGNDKDKSGVDGIGNGGKRKLMKLKGCFLEKY